ncbi:MAG TPA: hypothetical protein DD459_00930 [Halieaceae bacterium]|nr:hypothetical protein [Halieaceae bacterium]|tara:strand:- start:2430 stop:4343 length:1914 start_codon:yes stop_codon:yes gene_type:complete
MRSTCRLLLAILLLLAGTANAAPSAPLPLDRAHIERWADEQFGSALQAQQITGGVIAVVKNGALLFSKGYGRANVETGEAVDPQRTRFRIGSITKTFTATLVAQLVDEGVIGSIDDPANQYLKRYQLPDNNGVPVTLRHLLTHSAGFEDSFYHIAADAPQDIPLSGEEYDRLRPAFVRPAGSAVVYSNFGVATLGVLLEDQLEAPIAELMQQRILQPLGMTGAELLNDINSRPGVALPGTIAANGSVTPTEFAAINPALAQTGALVATGDDMARYMLAHLDGGRSDDALMSPAGFTFLTTPYATNADGLTQVGATFFLEQWNDSPVFSHGGNWVGFHSWMSVLPEQDTGVFISLLSEAARPSLGAALAAQLGGQALARSPALLSAAGFNQAFLGEFLGAKRPRPEAVNADLQHWVGSYLPDRRPFTTIESAGLLFSGGGGGINITAGERGLYLSGAGPYVPVGDGVFVNAESRDAVALQDSPVSGAPQLTPDIGIYTYTRVPAWRHPALHATLFVVALGIAAALLLCHLVLSRGKGWDVGSVLQSIVVLLLPVVVYTGYGAGQTMTELLHHGHLGRSALLALQANLLFIVVLVQAVRLLRGIHGGQSRLLAWLGMLNGLLVLLILSLYNVTGWQLPG